MNRPRSAAGNARHQAVQELLPWYATGALDAADMALVQEHLRDCPQCQADAVVQRALRAAWPQAREPGNLDQAFLRLRRRLDQQPTMVSRPGRLRRLRQACAASAPWVRWTLAGQAGIIAAFALLLVSLVSSPGLAPRYHGLGEPRRASGGIVVTFKPQTSEQELREILRASGARLVDGPTSSDAYVLDVPGAQRSQVLDQLRHHDAVTLAEPLDARESP